MSPRSSVVVLALGLVACTGTDSVTGEVPPGEPATVPSADPSSPSPSCGTGQALLPPRLVRLAGKDLREHVRRALPQPDETLLAAIELQAQHLARVNERTVSAAEFAAYHEAARRLAQAYVAGASEAQSCRQAGSEQVCLQSVLKTAVTRLYRSAPSAEEWASFEASYQRLLPAHGTARAAQAVVTGALLSPRALYQTERGEGALAAGTYSLSNPEALTLARLALTGKAPDDAELATVVNLDAQAFRSNLGQLASAWVRTPEFAERALDFVQARFGLEHLDEVSRLDPAFTPEVQQAMAAEVREHVASTLLSPSGSFDQLFTANRPSPFPGLETIYSADAPARRQGILGLAGLLAARASPAGSDPVKRGLLVRVELLCETMPPPIPDADFGKVAVTEDMQTRERFEALAGMPACQSCHQVINPPGYLFEEFDQLGRHRTMEKGRPIDATGTITPFFGSEPYPGVGAWDGIVPLANWLAQSKEARVCFATHFASYVLAQGVPQGTANCLLPSLTARFIASGRVDDLAQDLVQSDLFLQRVRGTP